jgi:phage-related protein
MSDIAKGVGNLFASVLEIIKGLFTTAFNLFEGALNAVIGLIKNTFNLAEGVLGFIIGMYRALIAPIVRLIAAGNIFILGTLAAVYFGYILLQQRQGKRPAPISKAATGKTN